MDKLSGITVFVKVVEAGSFTAASHALECSTSYVSKEITKLEKRLAVRLLNRSTRTLSLTDTGKAYFERAKQIIEDAEDIENSIGQQQTTPHGLLKMSVPVSFGSKQLKEVLPEFLNKYPDIQIDLELNDRKVDVVAEGFDLVIRATDFKDSNLIAKKIMSSRIITIASPDYIKKNGEPKTPQELAEHPCITYSLKQSPTYWEYLKEDGSVVGVKVKSRVQTNHSGMHIEAAVHGFGIGRLPDFICGEAIEEGKLVPILEGYELNPIDIAAVYPHRQYLSAKTRAFVDFLADKFK